MKKEDVIKKDFETFLNVQRSAVIDMREKKTVCELAGISMQTYNAITKNYDYLLKKFRLKL